MRTPQLLAFASLQPVIFVLLFRYEPGGGVRSQRAGGEGEVSQAEPAPVGAAGADEGRSAG